MKPPPFDYDLVHSVDEALALLGEHGSDAKVLAGGQSLLPLLSMRLARPTRLVDVNALDDLAGCDTSNGLVLGSMVRQRAAERSGVVREANALLAAAIQCIGHAAIRNRGTVGGSIAHADPAAELPTVLLLLDGAVVAGSVRGTRTIPAADLFVGFLSTSVDDDELLTAVQFPPWRRGTGWALRQMSRRHGDFAVAGAAATVRVEAGRVAEARLAFSGVASTPVRALDAERALVGEAPTEQLWADAAHAATATLEPPDDMHGSSAYRRHVAAVLARRTLLEACATRRGPRVKQGRRLGGGERADLRGVG